MIWQTFLDGLSVLGDTWPVVLGVVGVIILGCSSSFFLSRQAAGEKTISWRSLALLMLFFTVSVILRLVFITETFVPPYFDSVEHYRLVSELLDGLKTSSLQETIPTLLPGYYHLGFHFLAALLAFGLHTAPIDVILVLGQITLAAIPIPLFFLFRHETQNDAAAFFGTLLAGFGWYMPGFAVNWGKYPALTGLLALELVLSGAYFISRHRSGRRQIVSLILLVLGIVVSALFHSRTLIVIASSFVSWFIAGKLQGLPKVLRYAALGVLLATIVFLGVLVQAQPLLNLTLDPYLDDGLWVTLLVLVLTPFAWIKFPRGVYFNGLFIVCVLAALFIPLGNALPGFANQTLLDRPFVEMLLYLPLSVLGVLGLAGFLQVLDDSTLLTGKFLFYARNLTVILLLGFVVLIPLRNYNFYPSDCCNFVSYDDTVAFDWLEKSTPPDARVLIPSTQMHVLPSGPSAALVGTDAGMWVTAMAGRDTSFAPFETDFRLENTLEELCQEQVDYIYVGRTEQSFDAAQLQEKTDWYAALLTLPDVQLFALNGCSQ